MNRSRKSKRPQRPPSQQASPRVLTGKRLAVSSPDSATPDDGLSRQAGGRITPEDLVPTMGLGNVAAPSNGIRSVISLALLVHLLAITTSFLATVEPSTTHLALDHLFSPYVRATHFGADQRAVYLAHGEAAEQPHRLQIRRQCSAEKGTIEKGPAENWETIGPPGTAGLAAADRDARWLGTIIQLAESDQSGLAAELLLPRLERLMNEREPDQSPIRQVRIVRLPTELTTVVDDELPPPYVAEVIQRGERLDLVQIRQRRLNAQSTGSADRTISGVREGRGEADE